MNNQRLTRHRQVLANCRPGCQAASIAGSRQTTDGLGVWNGNDNMEPPLYRLWSVCLLAPLSISFGVGGEQHIKLTYWPRRLIELPAR